MVCPGSVRMEEGLPDTDNPNSLRGTAAHEAAAQTLADGTTPGYWLNQVIQVDRANGDKEPITVNQEDVSAIWIYYDYVQRRLDALGGPSKCQMLVEEKTNPGLWLGRTDCYGTQDCALIAAGELEFIDYKHGSGRPVDVKDNHQLNLYAIGELAKLDWAKTPTNIPVTQTIIQPRCPHPDGPIRKVTHPASDFFSAVDIYKAAAAATDDPDAPLVPGEHQCFFCKAKATCPAVSQAAMNVFSPVVSGVEQHTAQGNSLTQQQNYPRETAGTGWDAIESTLGRPASELTLEHMVRALDAEKLVSAWFTAIRERLTDMALNGTEVPLHKLVDSTTKRKWSEKDEDVIAKLARVRTKEGESIGKKRAMVEKPISPAQAEKTIRPVVSERSWTNIAKMILKPKGKPVLVPVTDPREPIKRADQIFEKQEAPQEAAPPWM